MIFARRKLLQLGNMDQHSSAAYSGSFLPSNPVQSCHLIRRKPATQSGRKLHPTGTPSERSDAWGSKTSYTQLRLDPLPPASAEAFLAALLGDDPSLAPLKPLLIARTEGTPFFLEETVRTLVETGVLVGALGAYRLAWPLEGLQVPATVHAVLAARIDRLPAEDKRLLQTAAVIGTDVSFALLRAIADLPEAAAGAAHTPGRGHRGARTRAGGRAG